MPNAAPRKKESVLTRGLLMVNNARAIYDETAQNLEAGSSNSSTASFDDSDNDSDFVVESDEIVETSDSDTGGSVFFSKRNSKRKAESGYAKERVETPKTGHHGDGIEISSPTCSLSYLEENSILKERVKQLEEQLLSSKNVPSTRDIETSSTFEEEIKEGSSTEEKTSNKYKRYFCIFCRKLVDHFSRHLLNKHKTEEDVVLLSSMKTNSKERKKQISMIRGRGSLMFNTDYNLNKGNLIIARRRKEEVVEKALKPCIHCHNYFKKSTLWRHYKNCTGKSSAPRNLQAQSDAIVLQNHLGKEWLGKILPGMEKDEIYDILIKDEAILEYGSYLSMRNTERHLKNMIRTKLRQLAKVKFEMSKINPLIRCIDEALCPEHYDTFVSATKVAAGFDGNVYKSPSLIGEVGRTFKLVASRRIIHYIKTNNDERKRDIEKWLHIYDHDYYNTIGRNALRQMQKKKWGKTQLVPLTEDIIKLNKYIDESISKCVKTLEKGFNQEAYISLNKSLMAQIQIFNRKRAGEIEKFEITDYNKRHNIQKESMFYKTLKPSEKVVANKYMRVETRGKLHLRPASMLLTHTQIETIEFILKRREEAGVDKTNPFVFGRKQTTFGAYVALKEAAYASDAVHPDLLLGTLLRKHIATTAQVLNFTENDMSNLASFLGHNINTHRNFYRLPSEAIHLAKISRLLMAMDEGTIDEFKGKSLEEINVNITVDEYVEDIPLEESCIEFSADLDVSKESQTSCMNYTVSSSGKRKCSQIKTPTKKKCSEVKTPTKDKNSGKHSWTTPERQTARKVFQKFIQPGEKSLPSPLQCREAIKQYKELQGLSINQVKGWVASERKRMIHKF